MAESIFKNPKATLHKLAMMYGGYSDGRYPFDFEQATHVLGALGIEFDFDSFHKYTDKVWAKREERRKLSNPIKYKYRFQCEIPDWDAYFERLVEDSLSGGDDGYPPCPLGNYWVKQESVSDDRKIITSETPDFSNKVGRARAAEVYKYIKYIYGAGNVSLTLEVDKASRW